MQRGTRTTEKYSCLQWIGRFELKCAKSAGQLDNDRVGGNFTQRSSTVRKTASSGSLFCPYIAPARLQLTQDVFRALQNVQPGENLCVSTLVNRLQKTASLAARTRVGSANFKVAGIIQPGLALDVLLRTVTQEYVEHVTLKGHHPSLLVAFSPPELRYTSPAPLSSSITTSNTIPNITSNTISQTSNTRPTISMKMPALFPRSSNSNADDDDYTILLVIVGGLCLYALGFYKLIRWGIAKSAKKTAENLASLESDLMAAYPDVDERKKWLASKRLETAYEGAWLGIGGAVAEKRKTWLNERIEALEFEDQGEARGEKGYQGV